MGGIVGKKLDPENVDLRHFRMERVLGAGGFGKVHAATKKSQPNKDKFFAIKELSKLTIIEKKAHSEVFDELQMLSSLDYPLVCNAHYAFQDERNLYLVMDLALGGDLRYRLNQLKKKTPAASTFMSEDEIRFDLFCVLLALNYVHKLKIVFRDLKPDNVLIMENGYILLTDFGISKHTPDDICKERSGTHGYMAPEVYRGGSEHSYNSDLFALGVMGYELLKGARPYTSDAIKDTKNDSNPEEFERSWKVPINKLRKEGCCSSEFCDFLEATLNFDRRKRISTEEALKHPFFKGFSEEKFIKFEEKPLFLPDVSVANCDSTNLEVQEIFEDKSSLPKPDPSQQGAFEKYVFNIDTQIRKTATQLYKN